MPDQLNSSHFAVHPVAQFSHGRFYAILRLHERIILFGRDGLFHPLQELVSIVVRTPEAKERCNRHEAWIMGLLVMRLLLRYCLGFLGYAWAGEGLVLDGEI